MAVLFPYQKEGVEFLLDRPAELGGKPHRFLADEQGLGKTWQALHAALELRPKKGIVICPAHIKFQWMREMIALGVASEDEIYVVRKEVDEIPPGAKWIIINYELVITDWNHAQLRKIQFGMAILDEAHKLQATDSLRSSLILGARGIIRNCFVKILLSGTPVTNRPLGLFPIVSTLAPELLAPYHTYVEFGKYFCNGFKEPLGGWNFKGAANLDELRERLRPFMLRREIKDVYDQLPPVLSSVVYLEVDPSQHPEVQDSCENIYDPEGELPTATMRRIIAELKFEEAYRFITNELQQADKIVVFAYHKNVIEELYRKLAFSGYGPVEIRGGLGMDEKDRRLKEFMNDPSRRVLLAQMLACGEGTDGLQKVCCNVIYVEIDWSAGLMDQSLSRVVRIKQTNPVKVTYLIASGTIEMVMAAVLERKHAVIRKLMQTKGKTPIMTIEAKLDRIIELLEGGAAAAPAKEDKPAKADTKKETKKDTKKDDKKKSDIAYDDVRDAAAKFINSNKEKHPDIKEQITKIIKEVGGAKNLDDLENYPENFQAFLDALAEGPSGGSAANDLSDI